MIIAAAIFTGAVAVPAIPSNPISATSISWPAASLPTTSPVLPPIASVPIAAVAPLTPLPAVVNAFPANPPDKVSIAPIAIPLPTALLFKFLYLSSSANNSLTLSRLKSLPSLFSSSCNNSPNVKPVSIAPPKPPNKPAKPPGTAPKPKPPKNPAVAPAPAPAIAALATSSESNAEPANVAIELTKTCGITLGLFKTPFIKPQTPLPSSSYILEKSRISSDIFEPCAFLLALIKFKIVSSSASTPLLNTSMFSPTACDC